MAAIKTFLFIAVLFCCGCEVVVRQCATQQDCFAGEICSESRCVTSNDPRDASTDPSNDLSNDVGDVCLECEPSECQNNGDCGTNQYCEKSTLTCACLQGSHACGDACPADDDPAFCGESCTACPNPEFGAPSCVEGACDVACDPGFLPCDDCATLCVECISSTDCDGATPICGADNRCRACAGDDECRPDGESLLCDVGRCVECTEANSGFCNGNSCDPATFTCTNTPLRSLDTCEACLSDTECASGERCVPMQFAGAALPGGYCLEEEVAGCSRPYPILTSKRSLSSPLQDTYCGIREDSITCAAFRDYRKPCEQDQNQQCGLPGFDDGQCRLMNGDYRCTFDCVDDDDCPGGGNICVNGLYCLEL